MANLKPKTVAFRRRRQQRTDYQKRLSLLMSGKPRLVVRLTSQKIIAQVVTFHEQGDKIIVGTDSGQLRKMGWMYSAKNMPAAYLTGYLIGKKAVEKGALEAILDTGKAAPLQKGRVFAFLKGAVDAGMHLPHRETSGEAGIFPEEGRLSGNHIQAYAAAIAAAKTGRSGKVHQQFTQYLKSGSSPKAIVQAFAEVKKKIENNHIENNH